VPLSWGGSVRVPALGIGPQSLVSGAGVVFLTLLSPGSGLGRDCCRYCMVGWRWWPCSVPFWGRAKGPFYLCSANSCWVDWWLRDVRGWVIVSWSQRLSRVWHGVYCVDHILSRACILFVLLQLKNGGVAKAKGEGEKEKECTTECKSRRRRDEKAPWALNMQGSTIECVLVPTDIIRDGYA